MKLYEIKHCIPGYHIYSLDSHQTDGTTDLMDLDNHE